MDLIQRIDASVYAEFIRNSNFLYPFFQMVHIIGVAIVVGSLLVGNVRLLGVAGRIPVQDLARHVYRWVLVGLVLFLVTGIHMALSFLSIFAINPVMWIKLSLITLAVAINSVLYRRQFSAAWASLPSVGTASSWEKTLAVLSVLTLLSVIVMGKLLAYIGGKD
jgi:hypothetical protein